MFKRCCIKNQFISMQLMLTPTIQSNPIRFNPIKQRPIVSSPHLQVYENGSLNVLDARDSDAGHYMCQALNGVGPGLSKVVRVIINGEYFTLLNSTLPE